MAATYTVALADEARAASTITGTDLNAQCGSGGNAPQCVARQSATECVVWCYTKTVAGYVHDDTTSNMCFCPTPLTDPTWN